MQYSIWHIHKSNSFHLLSWKSSLKFVWSWWWPDVSIKKFTFFFFGLRNFFFSSWMPSRIWRQISLKRSLYEKSFSLTKVYIIIRKMFWFFLRKCPFPKLNNDMLQEMVNSRQFTFDQWFSNVKMHHFDINNIEQKCFILHNSIRNRRWEKKRKKKYERTISQYHFDSSFGRS